MLTSMNNHDPTPANQLRAYRKRLRKQGFTLALLVLSLPALAGVMAPDEMIPMDPVQMTFTDSDSFNTALPDGQSLINFDNVDAGTVIPNGGQFGGITFGLNSDSDLVVSDNFLSTSPFNFLGLDDGFSNEFLSGDELTFGFESQVQAFGLFIVGSPQPDSVLPFDLQLAGGGLSVFNDEPELLLDDGGEAFFLGIVNENGFDSVRLNSFGDVTDPFFAFNIDDVTTVKNVPEPQTLVLMALGFVFLIMRMRRDRTNTPAVTQQPD